MRQAVIKYNNIDCGILKEHDNGDYEFKYNQEYIQSHSEFFINFNIIFQEYHICYLKFNFYWSIICYSITKWYFIIYNMIRKIRTIN